MNEHEILKETQKINGPHILKQPQISKEIQIMNEPLILKEPQFFE
jgi:hypothetical protein